MDIDVFRSADIDNFLFLAGAEGWISDRREMEFILHAFPSGCFTARSAEGEAIGFVTSIAYERSGWIGNLLVRDDQRGKGIGPVLFCRAVEALGAAGMRTIWLTASAFGKPIYERIGFRSVGTLERWKGKGVGGDRSSSVISLIEPLLSIDRDGWGDSRRILLEQSLAEDVVIAAQNGFIALRRYPDFIQLGPWGAGSAGTARILFNTALAAAGSDAAVVADVPSVNLHAAAILDAYGFRTVGSTELMFAGKEPFADLRKVYSLASMGSIG